MLVSDNPTDNPKYQIRCSTRLANRSRFALGKRLKKRIL